jgi:hypothetical protein
MPFSRQQRRPKVATPDPDKVFHYKFNETSGTVATDSSSHARNGTYNGTYTLGVTGHAGSNAVALAGAGYVTTPVHVSDFNPHESSWEMWVKTAVQDTSKSFIFILSNVQTYSPLGREIGFRVDGAGTTMSFGMKTTSDASPSWITSSVTVGTWTHFVGVVSGGTPTGGGNVLKLYKNGVLISTGSQSA